MSISSQTWAPTCHNSPHTFPTSALSCRRVSTIFLPVTFASAASILSDDGGIEVVYRTADEIEAAMLANNLPMLERVFKLPYVDECEAWPNGPYGDQVDASSGAFNRLAQRIKFDSSYSWVA